MHSNNDLAAVRDLRSALEPTDLSVARVRHRVVSTLDGSAPTGSRSRGWIFAAAGAAAATVLAIGVAVVAQPGHRTGPSTQQPGAVASAGSVIAVDLTQTPIAIPTGAYLYFLETSEGYRYERWVDPHGGIVVEVVPDSGNGEPSAPIVDQAWIAQQRAEFATKGPSLRHPTVEYLATLPTDPAALLAMISDQLGRDGSGDARNDLIFKGSVEFFYNNEPLLSPAVRAAYLAALALAPGAMADHSPRTFAGHDVYLVRQLSSFGDIGLIVDSASGRVVGYTAGPNPTSLQDAQQVTYAVVTQPGTRP